MTMNKKEQADMAALKNEVRIARALRWTTGPERDLPPPKKAGEVSQGWESDGVVVYQAWSLHSSCGRGVYTDDATRQKLYPACHPLFSTATLALQALRAAKERQFAEELLDIDAKLEALRGAA